jgi:hypothetical protein
MYAMLPVLLLLAGPVPSPAPLPIYLWHEPEWFEGVAGSFAYWTGSAKPTGAWGVAGPGISAEWTQGGESEWNSMGAPAEETNAECHRDLVVPRAGRYRLWVRYVEHRKKKTPFTVEIRQGGRVVAHEFGTAPVVSPNDEYMLYWGFSFVWGSGNADLARGPARVRILIDKKGEAWRQVDALLLTDDRNYTPVGREKPPFAYFVTTRFRPRGANWRGAGLPSATWARPKPAGRDFSLWTGVGADPTWWGAQKLHKLALNEVFHHFSPPADIVKPFHLRYPKPADNQLINYPDLLPGFYFGERPDLSPSSPVRRWLKRTRTPFYILTNYASTSYDEKIGPATYQALTGPLARQFLGYVHGEAIGSAGVALPDKPRGKTRAEHLAATLKVLPAEQAKRWSAFYKTKVPEEHWAKGISCLSVESIALAHALHESGARVVGYEEDATNFHVPMRIAFERGAARQYGGAWINYASGNFGDACNYFTQNPQVPRGAVSWFHSKYAVTDGVSACWYRKMYYLNYLGGASAIYWEQNLANQWILPGPGTHRVQLSPFGRGTEEFMAFLKRVPERGEPFTPVGLLLSHAHSYEPVNYRCKMLNHFTQDKNDLELRELFNVCWHPAAVVEGKPAAPDVQSLPSGLYGNIFDVLVDRPARARAIFNYPVIVAAGNVDFSGRWPALLEEYVRKGGTLVLNIEHARRLPEKLLGVRPTGKTRVCEEWEMDGIEHRAVPFEVAEVEVKGAKVLARAEPKTPLIIRTALGKGAVLLTLVPRMLGQDERAHPALPALFNGLTECLLPIEVCRADGSPVLGEVMYQLNRTRAGWLVLLVNNRGVDKTQNGVARVDRRKFVDVLLRTRLPVAAVKEMTEPRDLKLQTGKAGAQVRLRVHPGDVQVVYFKLTK